MKLSNMTLLKKEGVIMTFLRYFILAFVLFFVIDIVWLGLIAKNFYKQWIGHLMASQTNWIAAIIFYVLYIVFIVIMVLLPADSKHSLKHAMLYGALFGFITYATYDLTNLATLKDWPLTMTLVDIAWGTFLGFSVSSLAYLLKHWIF
jgi:uncharacterized membrane protein